jgi:hypothetical protein
MPTESERQRDTRIRLTVFAWLEEQTQVHGDVLPWSLLAHGLYVDGECVPLVSQQGSRGQHRVRGPRARRPLAKEGRNLKRGYKRGYCLVGDQKPDRDLLERRYERFLKAG